MSRPESKQYVGEKAFPPRIRLLRWLGRQSWIPRGHDKLLRLLHNPDEGHHFRFEIDFFGQRYRGDLAQYLDWLVFCYGAAPTTEVFLLRDLCSYLRRAGRRNISFYDIGANIGHHTLFMAPLADHICAFEPSPALINDINEKIELNQLTNVTLLPFALGEYDDSNVKYFPGFPSNSGTGSLIAGFPGVSDSPINVELRKGDAILDELGLPKIDIMKVDVQGFEPHVFRGLRGRIRSDRPAIMTEFSEELRERCRTEFEFRSLFYDNAILAEISGRNGRSYRLAPFDFPRAAEVLVLPPEMADFMQAE